jgi:hypothetical protein
MSDDAGSCTVLARSGLCQGTAGPNPVLQIYKLDNMTLFDQQTSPRMYAWQELTSLSATTMPSFAAATALLKLTSLTASCCAGQSAGVSACSARARICAHAEHRRAACTFCGSGLCIFLCSIPKCCRGGIPQRRRGRISKCCGGCVSKCCGGCRYSSSRTTRCSPCPCVCQSALHEEQRMCMLY